MLDVHIHLLHEVDDGPSDLQASVEMIALAKSLGFSTLVATPHLLDPLDDAYNALIETRMRDLSPYANDHGVTLRRGFEVRLSPDIGRRLRSGEPITLSGSKTVLVELPFSGWPLFTEHALFDILAAGFVPLLAHPERYEAAVEKPQRVLDLHEQGVMMQVTTGSIAGLFGKRAQSVAELLLRADAVEVLASDAHSPGRRFVSVSEGLARAERIVGPSRLRQLTIDNPEALLTGARLPPSIRVSASESPDSVRAKPWQMVRSVLPKR